MKNKKTIFGSSAAIVAAAALVAGGTFASYSDFAEVNDNYAGASTFVLDLTDGDGDSAIQSFNFGAIAPGAQYRERQVYLGSLNGEAVPNGDLAIAFQNVNDEEGDGTAADGTLIEPTRSDDCSSNSEAEAENGDCGDEGELSENIIVQLNYTDPAERPDDCPSADSAYQNEAEMTLADWEAQGEALDLGELEPGHGVCVKILMRLLPTAGNELQGDASTFDMRFDLDQV